MTRGWITQIGVFLSMIVVASQVGCPGTPTDANSVSATPTSDSTSTPTDDPLNTVGGSPTTTDDAPPAEDTDPPPTDDNQPVPTPGDSDGDGFSDDLERNGIPGSDPFDPNDTPDNPIDSDGDGCSDFDELNFPNFCDNDPNTEPVDPNAAFVFSLRVARHVDQPFTDGRLGTVFGTMNTILQTVQTDCPDVATEVTFERDGSIATFDVGDVVITTETALDAVFDLPQDIKVVNLMIGVCGLSSSDELAVVLGCAATGESLVIVEFAEPDVWAHEWGHVQGLTHRDGCARNLMHAFEVNTNAVNELERDAFLSPTPQARVWIPGRNLVDAAPAETATPSTGGSLDRLADEPMADWVDRVVGKTYLAGIPAIVVTSEGADAAPYLLAMLDVEDQPVRRRNIIRALGFTEHATAVGSLVEGVFSPRGRLTHNQFAAVAESFLALGRLSRSDAAGVASQFLMDGADPAYWLDSDVAWTYGSNEGPSLHRLLARLAIMAMGVSADDAALDFLRSLRQVGDDGRWEGELADQIAEAIARLDSRPTPRRHSLRPTRQR